MVTVIHRQCIHWLSWDRMETVSLVAPHPQTNSWTSICFDKLCYEKLDKSAETSSAKRSFLALVMPWTFLLGGRGGGRSGVFATPSWRLDKISFMPPCPQDGTKGDNARILRALDKLSEYFYGEEEKGEPLSEHFATILDASLRCWSSSEGVKLTCSKIKLSSSVSNRSVPDTNCLHLVGNKLSLSH